MLDRMIGIILGLVLGAGIVTAFVFLGSEDTIDAPSLGADDGAAGTAPQVNTFQIIAGHPPESGAPTFDYDKGDRVRLRVESDSTVAVEVVGLGITRTVPAGTPTPLEFRATMAGNFPIIVTASHIGVANVRVGLGP